MPALLQLGTVAFAPIVLSCSASGKRGHALYEGVRQPSEVATIVTQLAEVDQTSIPEGVTRVEVLPGCHDVVVDRRWVYVENNAYAYIDTGGTWFRFDVKAGHKYIIDMQLGAANSSNTFKPKWIFRQFDAAGDEVSDWVLDGTCESL